MIAVTIKKTTEYGESIILDFTSSEYLTNPPPEEGN